MTSYTGYRLKLTLKDVLKHIKVIILQSLNFKKRFILSNIKKQYTNSSSLNPYKHPWNNFIYAFQSHHYTTNLFCNLVSFETKRFSFILCTALTDNQHWNVHLPQISFIKNEHNWSLTFDQNVHQILKMFNRHQLAEKIKLIRYSHRIHC